VYKNVLIDLDCHVLGNISCSSFNQVKTTFKMEQLLKGRSIRWWNETSKSKSV